MQYNRCKEITPQKTIENIKNILEKLNIQADEDYLVWGDKYPNAPVSVRIRAISADESLASNGKGIDNEYALASGYAEFLERIQSGIMVSFTNKDFLWAPDEKFISPQQLVQKNSSILLDYFPSINQNKLIDEIKEINQKYLEGHNKENIFNTDYNDICTVPFYNVKENKIEYLPIGILMYKQHSNGLCAGNTPEEACVQGICEIFERYVGRQTIKNKLSFPNIPEEYYMQYQDLKNIIKTLNDCNIDVIIKDASLGCGLPVICILFENKNENKYRIMFGAHPNFPVAIERTLTEFCQGRALFDKKVLANETISHDINEKTSESVNNFNMLTSGYFIANEDFFTRKPEYEFDFEIWNRFNLKSNKNLLKSLTNLALEKFGNLYVRDISFLGFNAYLISMPPASTIDICAEKEAYVIKDFNKVYNDITDILENNDNSIDVALLLEKVEKSLAGKTGRNFQYCEAHAYTALLCSVILNDENKIEKYINMFLKHEIRLKKGKKSILWLKDYYDLRKSIKNTDEIKIQLEEKYGKLYSEQLFDFYFDISLFEKLLNQIKTKVKHQNEIITQTKNNIKSSIIEKYINNCPDQLNLKEVFDF